MKQTPKAREKQARKWLETYIPHFEDGVQSEFNYVMNNRIHSMWRGLRHTQVPLEVKRNAMRWLAVECGNTPEEHYRYQAKAPEEENPYEQIGAERAFDFLHARYHESSPKHYPFRAPQDRPGTVEEGLNAQRLKRLAKEALGSLFEPLYKEAGLEWDSSKEDEVSLIVEHILMAAYFSWESLERGEAAMKRLQERL